MTLGTLSATAVAVVAEWVNDIFISATRCLPRTISAAGVTSMCGAPYSSRRTEKSIAVMALSAVSAEKSFRQASLAANLAAKLAIRPGPCPASAISVAENNLSSSSGIASMRRAIRSISTVSTAQPSGSCCSDTAHARVNVPHAATPQHSYPQSHGKVLARHRCAFHDSAW